MAKKSALGKGLGALIKAPSTVNRPAPPSEPAAPAAAAVAEPEPEEGERVQDLPLSGIVPSPFQPRKRFQEEAIEELMDSIREHGVLQPLIVRYREGRHELIAGERRFRAASKLGLDVVPAIVREVSDREVLEMALIENLQREDLNPIEEAEAYVRLARDFDLRQEDIARRVGRNRATVANAMRLIDLDPEVQSLVAQSQLSTGHAKAILGLKDHAEQRVIAGRAVRKRLTVRDTEKLVNRYLSGGGSSSSGEKSGTGGGKNVPPFVANIQDKLRGRFATNVSISHGEKKGKIEIEYYGNEDLDRILELLGVNLD